MSGLYSLTRGSAPLQLSFALSSIAHCQFSVRALRAEPVVASFSAESIAHDWDAARLVHGLDSSGCARARAFRGFAQH